MTLRWLSRVAATLGPVTLFVALAGHAAWANSTINLVRDQLPATAATAARASSGCTDLVDTAAYSDKDLWLFELDGADAGAFVSVTLTFAGPDGMAYVKVIEAGDADGHGIVDGANIAFIATPTGWTLTGATAEITGVAEHFVLALTCPARSSGQPAPTVAGLSAMNGPAGSAGAGKPAAGAGQSVPIAESAGSGPSVAPALEGWTTGDADTLRPTAAQNAVPQRAAVPAAAGEALASTGQDIGGMLILGTTLVTSGALLLIVRRGRAHRGVHRRRRGSASQPPSRPDVDVVDFYPPLGYLENDRRPAVVVRRSQ